ncbi:hypothetical protein GQ600_27353 [Phytophthora cactorum]|nr:hypothetical protein GQ600_27353 [Phytophthora cactorum]
MTTAVSAKEATNALRKLKQRSQSKVASAGKSTAQSCAMRDTNKRPRAASSGDKETQHKKKTEAAPVSGPGQIAYGQDQWRREEEKAHFPTEGSQIEVEDEGGGPDITAEIAAIGHRNEQLQDSVASLKRGFSLREEETHQLLLGLGALNAVANEWQHYKGISGTIVEECSADSGSLVQISNCSAQVDTLRRCRGLTATQLQNFRHECIQEMNKLVVRLGDLAGSTDQEPEPFDLSMNEKRQQIDELKEDVCGYRAQVSHDGSVTSAPSSGTVGRIQMETTGRINLALTQLDELHAEMFQLKQALMQENQSFRRYLEISCRGKWLTSEKYKTTKRAYSRGNGRHQVGNVRHSQGHAPTEGADEIPGAKYGTSCMAASASTERLHKSKSMATSSATSLAEAQLETLEKWHRALTVDMSELRREGARVPKDEAAQSTQAKLQAANAELDRLYKRFLTMEKKLERYQQSSINEEFLMTQLTELQEQYENELTKVREDHDAVLLERGEQQTESQNLAGGYTSRDAHYTAANGDHGEGQSGRTGTHQSRSQHFEDKLVDMERRVTNAENNVLDIDRKVDDVGSRAPVAAPSHSMPLLPPPPPPLPRDLVRQGDLIGIHDQLRRISRDFQAVEVDITSLTKRTEAHGSQQKQHYESRLQELSTQLFDALSHDSRLHATEISRLKDAVFDVQSDHREFGQRMRRLEDDVQQAARAQPRDRGAPNWRYGQNPAPLRPTSPLPPPPPPPVFRNRRERPSRYEPAPDNAAAPAFEPPPQDRIRWALEGGVAAAVGVLPVGRRGVRLAMIQHPQMAVATNASILKVTVILRRTPEVIVIEEDDDEEEDEEVEEGQEVARAPPDVVLDEEDASQTATSLWSTHLPAPFIQKSCHFDDLASEKLELSVNPAGLSSSADKDDVIYAWSRRQESVMWILARKLHYGSFLPAMKCNVDASPAVQAHSPKLYVGGQAIHESVDSSSLLLAECESTHIELLDLDSKFASTLGLDGFFEVTEAIQNNMLAVAAAAKDPAST